MSSSLWCLCQISQRSKCVCLSGYHLSVFLSLARYCPSSSIPARSSHLSSLPHQQFAVQLRVLHAQHSLRNLCKHSLCNLCLSLCKLCLRIETLSTVSVLHRSKCRCLARSYSLLLFYVICLTPHRVRSSSSPSLQSKLHELFTALLLILKDGERFVSDCTYQKQKPWFSLHRSAAREQWLIRKAVIIPLSTEIFDIHLHDFVWCISSLICVLSKSNHDVEKVGVLLKNIWASADEADDIKSMQELFDKIGAKKRHQQICDLICHRLSRSTNLDLADAHVPPYLWMDAHVFKNLNQGLCGPSESAAVFQTRLLGGKFACKQYRYVGNEEWFANEAVIQASVRHANVLHLLCCTKSGSEGSLVMELMDEDLSSLLLRLMSAGVKAAFSLLEGVDLMLQIAKGVESLHEMGIMHRDVKSPNILVSHICGGRMKAKISDFGTSKYKQYNALYTTKRVGTTIWRAPEVLDTEDERKYTLKADTYSFAIVCAEILTGLPGHLLLPFQSSNEFCKALKNGKRPELPPSCPPAIASYIRKCWHGDPSQRPTFKEICPVLRFFKKCVLLNETEMLALPLQDDKFNFEEMQTIAAERQREDKFYHPVFNIPSELQFFQSAQESSCLLTRPPLETPRGGSPSDLPVLSMPAAFITESKMDYQKATRPLEVYSFC